MKLLVTGATGGTGQVIVRLAIAQGHAVTALVRSVAKAAALLPGATLVEGDARDETAILRGLDGCDAVISALGTPSFDSTLATSSPPTTSAVGSRPSKDSHPTKPSAKHVRLNPLASHQIRPTKSRDQTPRLIGKAHAIRQILAGHTAHSAFSGRRLLSCRACRAQPSPHDQASKENATDLCEANNENGRSSGREWVSSSGPKAERLPKVALASMSMPADRRTASLRSAGAAAD